MYASARVSDGDCLCFSASGSLDFAHHLSEIQLGDDKSFYRHSKFAYAFLRKRPAGDKAKLAYSEAAFAGQFDGALCHARRDAVGNDDDVSAFDPFFFKQGYTVH